MWFKTNGKNWKCLNLVLSLDRLFKKTWMFSWTFGVCFFHLYTVSKILGEELTTTNAGHFIRYFKIKTFWFTVIQLVIDCPVAPRITNLFVNQQLMWCVHFVILSWNTEFKVEYLKYFVFQKYNKVPLRTLKKMYNLKNVIYKGSCLPARVLLPRNFLISLIVSWGECWALENYG